MNYQKQLDLALRFLRDLSKESDGSFFYYKPFDLNQQPKPDRNFPKDTIEKEINSRLITYLGKMNVGEPYRYPIVFHLINDKYVDQHFKTIDNQSIHSQIRINLKGLLFIEKNGYTGKRCREIANHSFLLVTTIAVAIGTLGILVLELLKYHSNCLCK